MNQSNHSGSGDSSLQLSREEQEVLILFSCGVEHDEMALQMSLSLYEVLATLAMVFKKLSINDRSDAEHWVSTLGLALET